MPRKARTVRAVDIVGVAGVQRLCGGISRPTLARWRRGIGVPAKFPRPIKRLPNLDLWDAAEIRAWLAEHKPPPE